jgi:hypothetical protein
MGPKAVRCISVRNGIGAVIEGFTLRDGASAGGPGDNSDKSRYRAGAVNTTAHINNWSEETASSFTIVDCVVSNCVGTRGGALYGGNAVRCLISDNKASNYGCAARQTAFFNCVITRNSVVSGYGHEDTGVVAYPLSICNCTFVNNGETKCIVQMASTKGPVRNTLFVNNAGSLMDSVSKRERFHNCVMQDTANVNSCDNCILGNDFELMNPLFNDYRLVEGSKSIRAGSVEALNFIPEAYRSLDFEKRPRVTDGAVSVGAVERVGRALSTICFAAQKSNGGKVKVNGWAVPNNLNSYASTDVLPAIIRVEASPNVVNNVTNCPSRYWLGDKLLWPSLDDSLTVSFPQSGVKEMHVVCCPPCYVDAVKGDDTTGDGSVNKPYNTIQEAIDKTQGNVVILVNEGVYDKGGKSAEGCFNRVFINCSQTIRIKATGDRSKTIIQGASDKNSPDGTGCGPEAVRCVFIARGVTHLVQGFTLKGGRTAYSSTYGDGDSYRAGGFWGYRYASTSQQSLADSVITDCCAGRGAAAFGGYLYRCVITNNFVAGSGNSVIREGYAYSCLIADNYANQSFVVGQGAYLYQCTIVSNRNHCYPIGGIESFL